VNLTLLIATPIIVVLAVLLGRALLKLRRLEAPMQFSRALTRAGWGELPQSWMPTLTEITISAHDMFWETDQQHSYTGFFKRANAFGGFDLSDLTGKAPWDIPSIGVSAAQWDELKATMAGREPFHNFVVGRTDPAGRVRFGSMSGAPVFDARGGFVGYRGASRDVTILRHAQVQLQIQNEITRILAASHRLSEALPGLIEAVCRPLEWTYGARWMLDARDQSFVCGEIWALSGAQPLVEASKKTRVPAAAGDLLARAWADKALTWVANIQTEPDSARRSAALSAHLGAAFALPIVVQGDIVCLLEFFGPRPQYRDDCMDAICDSLNHQLALFWLRREAEARLTYAATHDALTGLRNRLAFQAELDKAVARAERNGWRAALLFIDLDGFKRVNDSFGHAAGDLVLAEAARRFKTALRASDTISRLGGDEFVVLLEQAGDDGAIADVANKLVRTLSGPFAEVGEDTRVGASVGIAIYPVDARDPALLLQYADSAMYKAKDAADSSIAFYRPPADQRPVLDRSVAPAAPPRADDDLLDLD
jgi:diguanylate cyclase (GGDEF)-like protein